MSKTFFLETFGCQMNVVDSERIVALLEGCGYAAVDRPEAADLILLNTCSVRDKAERKVYGHLGRFKPLKQANPRLILGVGGCVAQQEGERMLEKLPYLDLVFGTHNVHLLPELVRDAEAGRRRGARTEFLDRETRLNLFPERSGSRGISRYVTVMQGCDNFCSFCIVPHVRGREISRPSGDLLAEIRLLAEQGVREVTLIGQNVNSYGTGDPGELSFAGLLHRVAEVAGIERIRFTTSHPKDLSEDLVACFAELPQLCSHLHLPVQSGSDRVLRAMNRRYDRRRYLELVERLRQSRPEIRLTSDIIVGFPGETEEDFLQTLELLDRVRFADVFSFLYSPRPGTAAAELEDGVPAAVKQERFERMLALQQRIAEAVWAADVGRELPVLVEGESRLGEGQLFGRTTWNRIVNFDGSPELVGTVVPVRIVRSFRNSQLGEPVQGETLGARAAAGG